MAKSKKVGMFSFFTGAGFLDLGFERAGVDSLMANEIDKNFSEVYRHSRAKMSIPLPRFGHRTGDVCAYVDDPKVAKELKARVAEAKGSFDVIGFIGGPPCPDFSVAGKQAGSTGKHGRLSQVYVDMICEQKPDFFVFENVKGLWRTAKHRAFFDALVRQVQDVGYATTCRLCNALEYGAPQFRERIILIGVRKGLCKDHIDAATGNIRDFPWEDHLAYSMDAVNSAPWPTQDRFAEGGKRKMPPGVIEELTVEHWFRRNDVERHPNAKDVLIPRAGLVKMQTYDEGDDSRKCYKRIHRWRFSPTAAYGNNEVHLHPYKARRLSVAETLAIQSLPAEFELPPSIPLTAKFKTIGNGVPYLLSRGIAETLLDFLGRIG